MPQGERCELPQENGLIKRNAQMQVKMNCLVCYSQNLKMIQLEVKGSFWGCLDCEYVFKDAKQRLILKDETQRYREHNNDLNDSRYLEYLLKTFNKISTYLSGDEKVIDYGCGPTKGLEKALEKTGYDVTSFDPIFFPKNLDKKVQADVIFCSEAIEHSYEPIKVFDHWEALISGKGWVTLRTAFHPGLDHLKGWWYLNDPTHVGFFSEATWKWIAEKYSWKIDHMHSPYVSFQVR